ncbi:hypothetical protein M2401_000010 [Pseudomonas sp. JUb42]|uniref:DUF2786 domain-containing protein n=1 Tax=Pseudomonas sp. JUb42 TaxID=2940611 RepID=UPI0038F73278|nr:hypothetical protein [Pseudomonas sp. JUb42]
MDRQRIIEKVAKCFALANAKGATANEAATALRQGRWLMEQYNLLEEELQAYQVNDASVLTGTLRPPASWLYSLARTCAKAFDCDYLAYHRAGTTGYSFKFIGTGVSPEGAAYAYSALHQQLLAARRQHVSEQKRCKLSTKRRRGQLFAEAWISAVENTVERFAGSQSPQTKQAITAYLAIHHPNLQATKPKETPVRGHDSRSLEKGWVQGSAAYLHQGVNRSAQAQLPGGGGK